jgi:hypothetical protein
MDSGNEPDLFSHISQREMLLWILSFVHVRERLFHKLGTDNAMSLHSREISMKINGAA